MKRVTLNEILDPAAAAEFFREARTILAELGPVVEDLVQTTRKEGERMDRMGWCPGELVVVDVPDLQLLVDVLKWRLTKKRDLLQDRHEPGSMADVAMECRKLARIIEHIEAKLVAAKQAGMVRDA